MWEEIGKVILVDRIRCARALRKGPGNQKKTVRLPQRKWSRKGMERWTGGPDHTGLGGIWVYVLRVMESH